MHLSPIFPTTLFRANIDCEIFGFLKGKCVHTQVTNTLLYSRRPPRMVADGSAVKLIAPEAARSAKGANRPLQAESKTLSQRRVMVSIRKWSLTKKLSTHARTLCRIYEVESSRCVQHQRDVIFGGMRFGKVTNKVRFNLGT